VIAPGPLPSIGAGQAEAASVAKPAEDAPTAAKAGLSHKALGCRPRSSRRPRAAACAEFVEPAPPRAGNNHSPKIQSLAVLPLENLSGDSAQEYFVDGMTEELITDLGKIAGCG